MRSLINEQQAAKSSKSTRRFAYLNLRRKVEIDVGEEENNSDKEGEMKICLL